MIDSRPLLRFLALMADEGDTASGEDDASEDIVEIEMLKENDGQRADKALATHFPDISRERLKVCFDAGQVWREGVALQRKTRIAEHDRVSVILPVQKPTTVEPVEMPLDVLFEDESIVVINKVSGVVVHPGNGVHEPTLVHGLLYHTNGRLARAGGDERPGVVHRLDRDTSGAIVFAKTDEAYYALVKAFSERYVKKEYLAIVVGEPKEDSGTIKKPIDRHPVNRVKMAVREDGRFAHTDWSVEQRFNGRYTLIRCRIHTGRTHQIRVHLSDMGFPIWGDRVYGYKKRSDEKRPPERFLLHAEHLIIPHPVKEGVDVDLHAPLAAEFQSRINVLVNKAGG
ncbi:RluA family pseudouridine synthase [Rubellicoccus peritrichatus]|uniref:Pseudouridine synthase n=1 Tax=Rubellicoccus peritrichatus TaxID=3080537 RepID=A0AAQ3LCD4_9BACT|nr:RluA family pseudouridine synthase [Puniceicoccus sp. CR14]WOO42762.1 RluA family pseudouridine synthase [Puniceicoccus sp. CR14]